MKKKFFRIRLNMQKKKGVGENRRKNKVRTKKKVRGGENVVLQKIASREKFHKNRQRLWGGPVKEIALKRKTGCRIRVWKKAR